MKKVLSFILAFVFVIGVFFSAPFAIKSKAATVDVLTFELEDGIYNIYTQENKYLGLGIVKNKLLKRDVII